MISTIRFERGRAAVARRAHNPEVARAIRALATTLCAITLAGCSVQVRHAPVPLPLPARPVLTPVSRSELQCLADSTYLKLAGRERGYKNWGLELEAIIRKNNEKADAGAQ